MSKLTDKMLTQAGFSLFCAYWADECERHGHHFFARTKITDVAPRPKDEELLPVMQKLAKELGDAWKRPVEEVFTLMGLPENKWDNALYYCLMACVGHCVELEDDYNKNIEQFEDATGEVLDTSPIYADEIDFHNLAYQYLPITNPSFNVVDTDGGIVEHRFVNEEAAQEWINDTNGNPSWHVEKVRN